MLADSSSNKIPPNVRGTSLMAQRFGRARDLVLFFEDLLIENENGAKHVVEARHKSDPLTLLSYIFAHFNKLISARSGDNETFKNIEGRFVALVFNFNLHDNNNNLPESLTAFLLLSSPKGEYN